MLGSIPPGEIEFLRMLFLKRCFVFASGYLKCGLLDEWRMDLRVLVGFFLVLSVMWLALVPAQANF